MKFKDWYTENYTKLYYMAEEEKGEAIWDASKVNTIHYIADELQVQMEKIPDNPLVKYGWMVIAELRKAK